jgi:hypothetical protein
MARLLFVVEDLISLEGRGVALLPGMAPEGDEVFRIGDHFVLKRPDGSTLTEKVSGIGFIQPPTPLVFNGLTKEGVPIGTEVWSVDKHNYRFVLICVHSRLSENSFLIRIHLRPSAVSRSSIQI